MPSILLSSGRSYISRVLGHMPIDKPMYYILFFSRQYPSFWNRNIPKNDGSIVFSKRSQNLLTKRNHYPYSHKSHIHRPITPILWGEVRCTFALLLKSSIEMTIC